MTPILVTGGAGFIGSHTCKALYNAGFLPLSYDNLSRGRAASVQWGPLVTGDIADSGLLRETLQRQRPSAVVPFAAFAYVGERVPAGADRGEIDIVVAQELGDAQLLRRVVLHHQ